MTDFIEDKKVYYKDGYKNQLTRPLRLQTSLRPRTEINLDYIYMDSKGQMTLMKGYAWNGASGPTYDTSSVYRGSGGHDAEYTLIQLGYFPKSDRKKADNDLNRWLTEDKMWWWRRKYWIYLLRKTGWVAAGREPAPEIEAP